MAPMEQQPAIATLLLQLDLMMTGFDKPYNNLMKAERTNKFDNDYVETMVSDQELWNWSEVAELESCQNGEVLSMVHLKGRLISSHSDK
ncbi:hypothetical protein LINPERHAP2_LOCUS33707 [Linum perenne]